MQYGRVAVCLPTAASLAPWARGTIGADAARSGAVGNCRLGHPRRGRHEIYGIPGEAPQREAFPGTRTARSSVGANFQRRGAGVKRAADVPPEKLSPSRLVALIPRRY